MEQYAFIAGAVFGFLMLATLTAVSLHIGDPAMIKLAIIATVFGYATQVLEFYRLYDARVQIFGYLCWAASVISGIWLIVLIMQWHG